MMFWIQFIGVALGMLGAGLTASAQRPHRRYGFVLWIISNLFLITWAIHTPDAALVVVLYMFYTSTSAWGVWNNRRLPKPVMPPSMNISTRMSGTIDADGRITDMLVESIEHVVPSKPWPKAGGWMPPGGGGYTPGGGGYTPGGGGYTPVGGGYTPVAPPPPAPPRGGSGISPSAGEDLCSGGCCDCD